MPGPLRGALVATLNSGCWRLCAADAAHATAVDYARPRGGCRRMTTKTPAELYAPEQVPVAELRLDARNPRIQRTGERLSQDEILNILWREYSVDEVAWSIARNGYFPHEALFAAEEDGALVVIEGNRRLAAVRLLREPDLRERMKATDLPSVLARRGRLAGHAARESDVAATKSGSTSDSSTSTARKHGAPSRRPSTLPGLGTTSARISPTTSRRTIGDRHRTVARLYRAYKALVCRPGAGRCCVRCG